MDQRAIDSTPVQQRPRSPLPHSLTCFVAREAEIKELVHLIEAGPLVTISGAPGSGKSRLAIEVASRVESTFRDGLTYVDLAACSHRAATEDTIAGALGIAVPLGGGVLPGGSTRPALDVVADAIADRQMLLVLDNAEKAAGAVAEIAPVLLRTAPQLKILVASQIPLATGGELVWHIPLLSVPEEGANSQAIAQSAAIQLFVDRAAATDPRFALDEDSAPLAAEIVRQLDGNPLAIELAAARANVLGVAELASRLTVSFDVLEPTQQPGDQSARSLMAAISWGFELLSPREQRLFEALSTFQSDFTVKGAEAVGADEVIAKREVIQLLSALVDASMVQLSGAVHDRTYHIGAALRRFARERLEANPTKLEAFDRHGRYHFDFVSNVAHELRAALRPELLDRVERHHSDLVQAVEHSIDSGDPATAVGLVSMLYPFWFARRHEHGRHLTERVLAMKGGPETDAWARARLGAALLAIGASDFDVARGHLELGRVLAQEFSEELQGEAALYSGFLLQQQGKPEAARPEFARARAHFESSAASWGSAWADWFTAVGHYMRRDFGSADAPARAALASFHSLGNSFGEANSASLVGTIARGLGDPLAAVNLLRRCRELWEALGDQHGVAAAVVSSGLAELDLGETARALDSLAEGVTLVRKLGDKRWLAEVLVMQGEALRSVGNHAGASEALDETLSLAFDGDAKTRAVALRALRSVAWLAYGEGRLERAVTLFSASARLGAAQPPRPIEGPEAPDPGEILSEARARFGVRMFESLVATGRSLSFDAAVELACSADRAPDTPSRARGLSLEDIELGERVNAQLVGVSERREVRIAGLQLAGRRRRPSGEREPLPRELVGSGLFWLVVGIVISLIWVSLFAFPGSRAWWDNLDHTVNTWFVSVRNDVVTETARAFHAIGSQWFFRPVRWAMLLLLVGFKRWRHLFAALIVFILTESIVDGFANMLGRPRPFVEILSPWAGYSHPSAPAASVAATLTAIGFAMLPDGCWRQRWWRGSGVVVMLLVAALTYLGVDHLTDGVVGAAFGAAVAVVVFKLVAPESLFPVSYSRGSSAHLDIGGARGRAIRRALADQLGVHVLEMKPFGLAGSGGSTPIRLEVASDPPVSLFAKLYSTSHLRADRWYKLARAILYGALEDEVRFTSVRRLVEYEDYMLLRMKAAAVPSAEPLGFVEITPEREYLIVTEFLQDAEEITEAEVNDAVVDDGLLMVRRLWDAGIAHRDIKPANVLVRDGKVRLIDVAFATVRPSPWRQAVDLANMLMILAIYTGSVEHVYRKALRYFAPSDIAEAFAATRSVTIPSQSRSKIKELRKTGVDIVAEFRSLAPPIDPIAIQRWSARRIRLAAGAVLGILFLLSLLIDNISSGGLI